MSVIRCKMCGGNLNIDEGSKICTCESCGTMQTLPRLDDERRLNLYDRANHFRRNNEFDKAMSIYETILNEDPDDAEAYWSLILCKYGIEYVEDSTTHKRVITCNRTQYTSIFADEDYKLALDKADDASRRLYVAEANEIDRIQKGILDISSKEEPFDVFICYKETDANGRRTQDSVLAQELYYNLTNEGYKVFFSRITLEDKLGSAYEPYIFAALNSAKVMVVVTTRPDYVNSPWVKNEWGRYLSIIKQDNRQDCKKVLIPAYRDMDPYDLPEEFSHLQAQDMSKLGFMLDLVRGIKKILSSDEQKAPAKETVVTLQSNLAPLIKRGFMFLEDGEFDRADGIFEQALNQDPECAKAYLGKLMINLKVKKQVDLASCAKPFDGNKYYKKIELFSDATLINVLTGYNTTIRKRLEEQAEEARLRKIEREKEMERYKKAAIIVAPIVLAVAMFIVLLITVIIPNIRYAKAKGLMESGKYANAIEAFEALDGFRDSNEKILAIRYTNVFDLIEKGNYTDALYIYKGLNKNVSLNQEAKEEKDTATEKIYSAAVTSLSEQKYDSALTLFTAISSYKDSKAKITSCYSVKFGVDESMVATKESAPYLTLKNGTLTASSKKDLPHELVIPAVFDGVLVEKISTYAFKECDALQKVTIPETIKTVSDYSFMGCKNLSEIVISNGVTEIGKSAFENCTSLKSLVLPESITNADSHAFDNCPIETATMPAEACNSIQKNNFLTKVIINCGNSIAEFAFCDCKNLTDVTIADGVTEIEQSAFMGCSGLKSITIPEGVTRIGELAFSSCPIETATVPADVCESLKNDNLKTLIISGGTSISDYAFVNCTDLISITIPDSVESIGKGAFWGCTQLKNIVFPSKLTKISADVCYDCESLTSITIPSSVKTIENDAFHFCEKVTNVTFLGTKTQWSRISKGTDWGINNFATAVIKCSNGTVTVERQI